ncbi:TPA: relaxase/mobilization nuclease domain-containing protein [Pseudomonas aeruginosa]|uniref:TraI/MobA(P) family conjugative relaxase n=1 Tax=Acidovorax sp. JHL-9 TaxID=1276756 RepID=UPI0004010B13|nr:TraI/MobA(P) family conjugative relaxase [Acidovorax sp. JHL-9]HBN9747034.1 relaxase/mobilization nuclease domain-containing protein [Pseudomonas aeruginosa]
MIAKHVPMRSLGKSDFAGLVNYVTDAQSKDHRLGQVQITNCDAVSVQDAITEVLATQHTNTRAKGDKTYHLIVSFRAGEQPSADTLRAIEERICAGLGYGEHQRVSAVHNDTDNLHIHIAINKIHPTRHTMHEPYYSHRALAELCTALERDYGLERDNHEPRQRGAEGRAADMERHAGVESLVGWIKRECLDEIKGAQSWQELHQVMRDNGLELRERANGLVIEAGDGTMVKASTLARDLSKPKLEARLGPFEASPERQTRTKAKRQYQKDPIRLRVNTVELYARYKEAQQHLTATRAGALAEANRRKDRAVENVKKVAATKRAAIKHLTDGRLTKRLLYSQASAALRADLEAIHKRHDQERAAIYQAHSRRTWADWLKQQAQAGDGQALDALRAREAAQGLKGDTLQGEGVVKAGYALVIDNITKKGTIIYRAGSSAVRDDGERLAVSSEADRAGVLAALRMAMGRYGERITVSGSVAFKATAIRAAVDARLPIVFTDPILERRRLVEAAKAQARVRPGAPPVGRQPPPHRRHGLHTLGQLGGLYIEGGAQRPTQAPMPAKVRSSAPSELAQREARLRAQMEAKRAKRQENGKGRGR